MNASELRIGNIIHDNENPNRVCRVLRLTAGQDYTVAYSYDYAFEYSPKKTDQLTGVPLTEEWLKRFGFEKEGNGWILSDEFDIILQESENKGLWTVANLWCGTDHDSMRPHTQYICMGDCFKYVHQLQNLIFALTQTELTLTQI